MNWFRERNIWYYWCYFRYQPEKFCFLLMITTKAPIRLVLYGAIRDQRLCCSFDHCAFSVVFLYVDSR